MAAVTDPDEADDTSPAPVGYAKTGQLTGPIGKSPSARPPKGGNPEFAASFNRPKARLRK